MVRNLAIGLTLVAAGVALAARFAPMEFDLRDPKGVSGMSLRIDSPLEPVHGYAGGVSGSIAFDPTDPARSTGKVAVTAKEVFLGSAGMTEAMHEEWCLDVENHPTIEFDVTRVRDVREEGVGRWSATVDGELTIKGVTRPLTAPATVTHVAGGIKRRGGMAGVEGDLLVIRSRFSFDRLDFGIAPDLNPNVIGRTVEVDLSVVGASPR
jgi:Uncharacterized conserved protein